MEIAAHTPVLDCDPDDKTCDKNKQAPLRKSFTKGTNQGGEENREKLCPKSTVTRCLVLLLHSGEERTAEARIRSRVTVHFPSGHQGVSHGANIEPTNSVCRGRSTGNSRTRNCLSQIVRHGGSAAGLCALHFALLHPRQKERRTNAGTEIIPRRKAQQTPRQREKNWPHKSVFDDSMGMSKAGSSCMIMTVMMSFSKTHSRPFQLPLLARAARAGHTVRWASGLSPCGSAGVAQRARRRGGSTAQSFVFMGGFVCAQRVNTLGPLGCWVWVGSGWVGCWVWLAHVGASLSGVWFFYWQAGV